MKQKITIILLLILLLELSFFALCGKLCHAQTPAPEPAVDNLIQENWKNRQGIFVELTDSTSAVDNQMRVTELPYNTAEPAKVWPVDTVKTIDDFPNVLITTHGLVYLWQQYKAECYADSTHERVHKSGGWQELGACWGYPEGGGCRNENHYEWIWIHKEPTGTGFFNWLGGRVK